MSILSTVFGGGVSNLVTAVGEAGDALFTSDEERGRIRIEEKRIALEEAKLADRSDERQVQVNMAEAQHKSMFVAGWRPFVGWVCGVSMAYHFLVYPIFVPFLEAWTGVRLVNLEWSELSVVLMGMLGFGGLRTFEKQKGITK